MSHHEYFGLSDIGQKRDENEDTFLIADLRRQLVVRDSNLTGSEAAHVESNRPGKLLVVADGLGGHAAGERASNLTVETLCDSLLNCLHQFIHPQPSPENDLRNELAAAVDQCHSRLKHEQDEHAELTGMGTTLTAAYIIWPQLYVMHVGDTRCYLLRDGTLRRLTKDHTLGQQLVDNGCLKPEDLPQSPYRNVLWNCIGADAKDVVTDITHEHLRAGDRLLLCSDGLTDCVDEDTIQEAMSAPVAVEDIVRDLIKTANANGGPDNITLVMGRFGSVKPSDPNDTTVEMACQ